MSENTPFLKGDALSIVSFMLGRSDSSAWEGIFATDICAWDASKLSDGAKETIDKIANRVANQVDWMELGPAPGMPFFVPAAECDGITWPKLPEGLMADRFPYNMWSDMTRAMWNANPYTFIRKTLRGASEEVAFFNKITFPFQAFNAKKLNGQQLELQPPSGGEQRSYPGWSSIVFKTESPYWSGWQFHTDGVLRTAWIEHRKLNEDGTEADALTRYWKPRDIFENVILPRINRNMPIKTFGWNFTFVPDEDGDPVLSDKGLIHTGWIFKPRHIAAAQCQFIFDTAWIDPANWTDPLNGPVTTWENAYGLWAGLTTPPVLGMIFNHYYSPAYCLPYLTAILSDCISLPVLAGALVYFLFGFTITGYSPPPTLMKGNIARVDAKDPVGLTEAFNLFAPFTEWFLRVLA